jgi:hypothetical protein
MVSLQEANLRALSGGVSIATVSHVLNGTRGTRQQTRQKVLAAIEELGYAQNQSARNLAMGRSTLLGLIISDIRNPFFPEVTAAFQLPMTFSAAFAGAKNTYMYAGGSTANSGWQTMGTWTVP